jgi:hypothetical protein
VTIRPTPWEKLGWAVSAATAMGLLLLRLPRLRLPALGAARAMPGSMAGGTAGTKRG